MGLALGIGAAFLGVVFAIVGWSGGGTKNMNKNLTAMMMGQWLPTSGGGSSTSSSKSGTSTTGGTYSQPKSPGTNP